VTETERDANGRFQKEVSESDVVAAVWSYDPAATSEVADELGIERQSADYRLRKLRDSGDVCSKKIGASLVWYLPRDRDRTENSDGDRASGRIHTDNRDTSPSQFQEGREEENQVVAKEEIVPDG
jgi:DNA-binding Lrp family transcriptional regulator